MESELQGFKKDRTPYLVFSCTKCSNFSYVKITQKTKKCLRCGRIHQVRNLISNGDIVQGMTSAVNKVIEKQNKLALNEMGHLPEFKSDNEFKVAISQGSRYPEKLNKKDNTSSSKFKLMLEDISRNYQEFPIYVLEVMAENYSIPMAEISRLTVKFQREGCLKPIKGKDRYYRFVKG